MKRLPSLLAFLCVAAFSLPAAADKLDGVLTLVRDDAAALKQVATAPVKHVMMYFGDYAN